MHDSTSLDESVFIVSTAIRFVGFEDILIKILFNVRQDRSYALVQTPQRLKVLGRRINRQFGLSVATRSQNRVTGRQAVGAQVKDIGSLSGQAWSRISHL